MISKTKTLKVTPYLLLLFTVLLFSCQPSSTSSSDIASKAIDGLFKIDFVTVQKYFPGCDPEKETCGEVYLSLPMASGEPSSLTNAVNQSVIDYMQENINDDFSVKSNSTIIKEVEKTVGKIVAIFVEEAEAGEDINSWTLRMESEVKYQSEETLVLTYPHFEFSGGVHPLFVTSFVNFDKTTGKVIRYEDLFKDIENLNALVQEGLLTTIQSKTKEKKKPELEEFFGGEGFSLPENFALLENSVLFLYYPEEAAPFVYGEIAVEIPNEKLF